MALSVAHLMALSREGEKDVHGVAGRGRLEVQGTGVLFGSALCSLTSCLLALSLERQAWGLQPQWRVPVFLFAATGLTSRGAMLGY